MLGNTQKKKVSFNDDDLKSVHEFEIQPAYDQTDAVLKKEKVNKISKSKSLKKKAYDDEVSEVEDKLYSHDKMDGEMNLLAAGQDRQRMKKAIVKANGKLSTLAQVKIIENVELAEEEHEPASNLTRSAKKTAAEKEISKWQRKHQVRGLCKGFVDRLRECFSKPEEDLYR